MTTLWMVILIAIIVVLLGVLFFGYQECRARSAMKRVDRSKLKNLDEDDWDDW